ncbi:MAG: hypothetical protein ACRERE_39740 [Candidatus Entotheonellia bacterium]
MYVALAIESAGAIVASEAFGVDVEAVSRRAAHSIAKQLKHFVASRKWIVAQ